jgi:hypothetical protein
VAQPSVIRGDTVFQGTATGEIYPKDGSVTPSKLSALPADNLPTARLRHQHRAALDQAGTAVGETRWVYRCDAANGAVVDSFNAGLLVIPTGNATVTVDLQKNGVTLLTAPIVLDSTNTAGVAEAGTLVAAPTTTLTTDDRLTIVVTVAAGTGVLGSGLFAEARVDESGV